MYKDESKVKRATQQGTMNIKRAVWTLVALILFGTSAVMVQEPADGAVHSHGMAQEVTYADAETAMATSSKHAMTRSAPASGGPDIMQARSASLGMEMADEDMAFKEPSMGQNVLDALDDAMRNIPQPNVDRMLVHYGYLSLQAWTGELLTMAKEVDFLVTRDSRGYVESQNTQVIGYSDSDKRLAMDIQFRLESRYFHETVSAIQELVGSDMVSSVSINSQDVTDSYIDAASRADTLEASRKALRILLEKANSVGDVMQVQRELNSLTQQYESQRQRAIHLKKQAEYSYLSVHWEEKKPIKFIGPQGWRPSRALLLAWSHMGSFCIALGDTLIYSLVWVIPLLVAYLVVLCFRKK